MLGVAEATARNCTEELVGWGAVLRQERTVGGRCKERVGGAGGGGLHAHEGLSGLRQLGVSLFA